MSSIKGMFLRPYFVNMCCFKCRRHGLGSLWCSLKKRSAKNPPSVLVFFQNEFFESLRLRFFQNAECLSLCGCSAFFMGGEVDEFRVTLGYTFFSRTQCSFEFSDRFKNRENGEKSIFIISAG